MKERIRHLDGVEQNVAAKSAAFSARILEDSPTARKLHHPRA
jgi:hypothetical protein